MIISKIYILIKFKKCCLLTSETYLFFPLIRTEHFYLVCKFINIITQKAIKNEIQENRMSH